MEKSEPSYVTGGNVKWYNLLGKIVWQFLKKLNIDYDPEILLLNISQKQLKYIVTQTLEHKCSEQHYS